MAQQASNLALGSSPLEAATRALDILLGIGSGYNGLWPSCMDLQTHEAWEELAQLPHAIPGQRDSDRAPGGSNLMHDLPAIGLALRLGEILGRDDYAQGAEDYLRTFIEKGTCTETGLLPWGEHSWMDLRTMAMGDGFHWPVYHGKRTFWRDGLPRPVWHDHLRQAPVWFWEKLGGMAPLVVQRFADGLDRHWVTDERTEYNRHGGLSRIMRHGLTPGSRSCDFPRHSGFYVLDLACAYAQLPREETRQQLWRYADYWWNKRRDGHALRIESRSPADDPDFHDMYNAPQTLSLAASLYEAAEILTPVDPHSAEELFTRSRVLAESALDAPRDQETGIIAALYRGNERAVHRKQRFLGSVYGTLPAASFALLCCAFHRWTAESRYLEMALTMAQSCRREVQNSASGLPVDMPALDAGLALDFLCEMYALTGASEWLETAGDLWHLCEKDLISNGLPRAATGANWYEAQQGSAYLLRGAARLGLLLAGEKDPGADLTAR